MRKRKKKKKGLHNPLPPSLPVPNKPCGFSVKHAMFTYLVHHALSPASYIRHIMSDHKH